MQRALLWSSLGSLVPLALAVALTGPAQARAGETSKAGGSSPQAQTAATQGPFAMVKDFETDGVTVQLLGVKRTSGNTVTVRWRYRNTTNERKQLTDQRTGWIDPYRLSVDAYLLDTANHTKYTVATDVGRTPIAARHGGQNSYIYIAPKQVLTTWAKFQAPPESVDKVTVSIPGVEPWEDVPISK
jgi:hypothetical protein